MDYRGNGLDIILQAFHWNLVKTKRTGTIDGNDKSWYQIFSSLVTEISNMGFTIVYLPPPWRDDSHWEKGEKYGGGEGYFWHDFDLDSRYGTKKQLTELITKLHEKKIKVIVDLVTNHRDCSRMKRDVWKYAGSCWAGTDRDTGGTFMDGQFDLALSNKTVSGRIVKARMNIITKDLERGGS